MRSALLCPRLRQRASLRRQRKRAWRTSTRGYKRCRHTWTMQERESILELCEDDCDAMVLSVIVICYHYLATLLVLSVAGCSSTKWKEALHCLFDQCQKTMSCWLCCTTLNRRTLVIVKLTNLRLTTSCFCSLRLSLASTTAVRASMYRQMYASSSTRKIKPLTP